MSGKAKQIKILPASVSLSELLEITVEELLISTKEWSTQLIIQFYMSKEALGSGSFRDAFIAECSKLCSISQWSVKK